MAGDMEEAQGRGTAAEVVVAAAVESCKEAAVCGSRKEPRASVNEDMGSVDGGVMTDGLRGQGGSPVAWRSKLLRGKACYSISALYVPFGLLSWTQTGPGGSFLGGVTRQASIWIGKV